MTVILVKVLVRDNAPWIPMLKTMLCRLEGLAHFEVWFYENDSVDNTRHLLWGSVLSESNLMPGKTRTERLATYRNRLKDHAREVVSDFVLLIDSNVFFSKRSLETMLETMSLKPEVDMVVPHASVSPCEFFYDTFATILEDGTRCGPFTSVVPCNGKHGHVRHCHRVTGASPIIAHNERYHKFKSCFGGFVLIRHEAYKKARWSVDGPDDCEHWNFCKGLNIVMDRESKVIWRENM
jgi:hypothetical protein